jgi:thioredoxin-like negative regulator of GroEL
MRRVLALVLLGLALGVPAVWVYDSWASHAELQGALRAAADGRFAEARPVLARRVARDPTLARGRAAFALGICEEGLGNPQAAAAAWALVPDGTPESARAALLRARIALADHRYAEAEPLLRRALRVPGAAGVEARQSLALILKYQGRLDEVRRLFLDGLEAQPNPLAVLRELWDLEHTPYPVEAVRRTLAQAERTAPDDDRVRLAQAHLALLDGRLDEAATLVRTCLERQPDDRLVWRLELARARAHGDLDALAEALEHLGAADLTSAESASLRAWLASRRGDGADERAALEERLDAEPGDAAAIDRLAELAFRAGQPDEAQRLRERKAAIDRAVERYRDLLFFAPEPLDEAQELARLAELLGRLPEAQAWLRLRLQRDPTAAAPREALARLERAARTPDRAASAETFSAIRALASKSGGPDTTSNVGPAGPRFVEAAAESGLVFAYDPGRRIGRRPPETTGGGLALLDYDGDGWLDVYAVQGGPFPTAPGARCADRLFRNNGDGTFADATERAGLPGLRGGYGMGVTAGDIDNDGHTDLFITRWDAYALYRNRGDGTFEDVTDAWGLGGPRDWPSSAAFTDLDGDGDLDLYVCHYLRWDPGNPQSRRPGRAVEATTYHNPLNYFALADHLFRNDGDRFTDVSREAGIADVDTDGRGLGVLAADFDDDGRVDLYVANDLTANYLFRNLGGMRFEEVAHAAGVAGSAEGNYQGSMGIACGDLDGDGRLDLAVTNFYGDSMAVYHGLGPALFAEHTAALGLKAPTRFMVGWGIALFDADNDGALDLAFTNGHLDDPRDGTPFAMPAQLFRNRGAGPLVEMTGSAGEAWARPRVGRALAAGDFDNDGRVDVLIGAHDAPLAYLRNATEPSGHFVTFQLVGTASNRDAIGAVVAVEAGSQRHVAQRYGGGSYQSADDPRLHFGTGDAGTIDRVEVRWPSGAVQSWTGLAADRGYRLVEGHEAPEPLPGFGPAVSGGDSGENPGEFAAPSGPAP